MRMIGAILLMIGILFLFSCWNQKRLGAFLLQIALAPIFIHSGLQLLK